LQISKKIGVKKSTVHRWKNEENKKVNMLYAQAFIENYSTELKKMYGQKITIDCFL
jgi:uncharacterized protein YjcR